VIGLSEWKRSTHNLRYSDVPEDRITDEAFL
jgi:hypothetical protein